MVIQTEYIDRERERLCDQKSNYGMSHQDPAICRYSLMDRTRKALSNIGTVWSTLTEMLCGCCISTVVDIQDKDCDL